MFHFTLWQQRLIVLACLIGSLLALPNIVPSAWLDRLPSWIPAHQVSLGLDLRGGSHVVFEVDRRALARDQFQTLADEVRGSLREAKIGFTGIQADERRIEVRLRDPDTAREAERLASEAVRRWDPAAPAMGSGAPAEIATSADGTLQIVPTDAFLLRRTQAAVQQSIEVIRRRIDQTGVTEPVIQAQGTGRILVQLPGEQNPQRIIDLLGATAKLGFRLVDERADPSAPPPHAKTMTLADGPRTGPNGAERIVVHKRTEIGGDSLIDAQPGFDQRTGQPVVNFRFDAKGTRRFADLSTQNVGQRFAIILDGKVLSAPVIREPITGGSGQISGSFTTQEAHDLSLLMRAGALPAPLTVVEQRSVGPDLGADAITAGIAACLAGVVLVVGYMALAYGLFGMFANIALILNLVMTIGLLSTLQATLTLPGIAGLLLSLGMAVDANVLINERIREETRAGRRPVSAIQAGFNRAFTTILDANLTTLIKMALLFVLGAGVIRGFAVTISLGIIVSMFTATLLVRWIAWQWVKRAKPVDLETDGPRYRLRLIPDDTKIPFMRGAFMGLCVSAVLSIGSLVLFATSGLNYGIDFKGGVLIEARLDQPADFPQLRSSLGDLDIGQISLQQFGAPNDVLIRIEQPPGGDAAQRDAIEKVRASLAGEVGSVDFRRVEAIGATVSNELWQGGMWALFLSIGAMLIYIWWRFAWQFGSGAVATLMLDLTKVVGFYAITGFQFNLTAIAAILTILGWSVNDKIVVYDRVRENLRKYKSLPLPAVIDRSINETLTRTVNTSITIFLSTVPLVIWGGEALSEFGVTLLFGMLLGTSSSIFIAAPILMYLGRKGLRMSAEDQPKPAKGTEAAV